MNEQSRTLKITVKNPYTKGDKDATEKFYEIYVLSESREVDLLNILSKNKGSYYSQRIFDKIFSTYKIEGAKDESKDYFLKNKYLYLTTRGVLNYLRLYEHQKSKANKSYYDDEIKNVSEYVKDNFSNIRSIVSLGAANSDKEINIFKKLNNGNGKDLDLKNIKYIPVDISDYLIHLGILNISAEPLLENLPVRPIIGDFWDLANFVKEKNTNELFEDQQGDNKRLFLLLGGTFGNYNEKALLDQIIQLMDLDDELFISVKLKKSESIGQTIGEDYDFPEDIDFLLEPLTYIPYFYGYAKYHRDLLIRKDKTTALSSEGVFLSDQKKFVSMVKGSECYAPYIELEEKINKGKKKIRLAWTTRYILDNLTEWLKGFTFKEKDTDDIYGFNVITKLNANDYALLLLKKTKNQEQTTIIKN